MRPRHIVGVVLYSLGILLVILTIRMAWELNR
jgi:hypothetical protein